MSPGFGFEATLELMSGYGKSWLVGNASRNETNEILTVYLVKGSPLYTG